jgi:hypothetical protein
LHRICTKLHKPRINLYKPSIKLAYNLHKILINPVQKLHKSRITCAQTTSNLHKTHQICMIFLTLRLKQVTQLLSAVQGAYSTYLQPLQPARPGQGLAGCSGSCMRHACPPCQWLAGSLQRRGQPMAGSGISWPAAGSSHHVCDGCQ